MKKRRVVNPPRAALCEASLMDSTGEEASLLSPAPSSEQLEALVLLVADVFRRFTISSHSEEVVVSQ